MSNKEIRSDNRKKDKRNSSVINSAVSQGLRYEHSGDSHEAEVSIDMLIWESCEVEFEKLRSNIQHCTSPTIPGIYQGINT